ncbi:helix-turn-helix domain-containing protein [Streptomyces gibsoniae]|uniref:Helix-turn-helix transcriptional regulator n=1 Tax=Streptomyces gibsoniae TaxID=3075529 RepID=A0ABU2TMK5_9ACTN|nr:helix-turn-helix transcriptional regulator [Streptomyces sp. DSM 41699]MDT0462172.1 helix-turn-helix transcriptional regulator [Streptomyces sp. DSM 41699]
MGQGADGRPARSWLGTASGAELWAGSGWDALTGAEVTVAKLIGGGPINRAVAAEMGISPNTVGTHMRSIFNKLGIHSRVQPANSLRDHSS